MNDPEFRKSLTFSILTSVLVIIFFDPLLKLASGWLMSTGSSVLKGLVDGIYASAALVSERSSRLFCSCSRYPHSPA